MEAADAKLALKVEISLFKVSICPCWKTATYNLDPLKDLSFKERFSVVKAVILAYSSISLAFALLNLS